MDFAEFWVLETAVRSYISLASIGGGDRYLRFQWNKPPHGLRNADLVRLMESLLDAGYVECYSGDTATRPTRSELSAALEARGKEPGPSANLAYCLTALGGDAWEAIAKPDWGRYFDDWWVDGVSDQGVLEITTATPEMLDYVIENGPSCWEITILGGWDDRLVLRPWEATYWKTLPEGRKVTLSYIRGIPPGIEKLRKELPETEFQSRLRKIDEELRRWYQHPFPERW